MEESGNNQTIPSPFLGMWEVSYGDQLVIIYYLSPENQPFILATHR